jgi:histidinol-phosphate phosphatase family protein
MSPSGLRPGAFLDLGGTLVLPLKPQSLSDYAPLEHVAEAIALLCAAGFVCPVVTVQSRIAKGLFTQAEFVDWFHAFRTRLASESAMLEGPYVCPHRYAEPCRCKKAGGSLYRRAAAELDIDLGASFVVGDSVEDMDAARILGCRGVLVHTGWPVGQDEEDAASHVADDVLGAARWIAAARSPAPGGAPCKI